MSQLQDILERAMSGAGSVALISGEPGIGKTRLVAELCNVAADAGVPVCWGHSYEGEGAPAYWPWIEILRKLAAGLPPGELRDLLRLDAAELSRIVPAISRLAPDLPALPGLAPADARFRLFESTSLFLADVSSIQPVVLVLDDLHWADRDTLRLLQFLGRRLSEHRILVLCTYRDIEARPGSLLREVMADLARRQENRQIILQGLSSAGVARLIEVTSGQEPAAPILGRIHEDTAGNPLFVTEIAGLLADGEDLDDPTSGWQLQLPDTVTALIGQRLDRAPPELLDVLSIAAVVGREFRLNLLERVTGTPLLQLLEIFDQGTAARLVDPVEPATSYRFSHPLIEYVLYQRLGTARRLELHRRVGEALEDSDSNQVEALAYHFGRAAPLGTREKARAYAKRAGDRAMEQFAWESATGHYQQALQLGDTRDSEWNAARIDLLTSLGHAWSYAGELDQGLETLQEALALAREAGTPEQLARTAIGYAMVGMQLGTWDEQFATGLEASLDMLPSGDSATRVEILDALVRVYEYSGNPERQFHYGREAVAMARRLNDPAIIGYALSTHYRFPWTATPVEEMLSSAREVLRIAAATNDPHLARLGHKRLQDILLWAGDLAAFDRDIDEFERVAQSLQHPGDLWEVAALRAMRAILDGRFVEAGQLVEHALSVGRQGAPEPARGTYNFQQFFLQRELGWREDAEAIAREVVDQYATIASLRCFPALLHIEQGKLSRAAREFDQLSANQFEALRLDKHWLFTIAMLAEVCSALANRASAEVLYERLAPFAALCVAEDAVSVCLGSAAHYLGLLATTLERWDEAEEHFEQALEVNRQIGSRPFVARTQTAYAEMLLRRAQPGDRERASALLEQAFAATSELGMVRLKDKVEALDQQLVSVPNPSLGSSGAHGLTPRQLEVLRLLVEGKSDREIAAELFISHYTAMRHVANILNALGVNSRTAAATYAVRHDLV